MKRCASLPTTIGAATLAFGAASTTVRNSDCWNSVLPPLPASARNCLGICPRDSGHSRVPLPPAMITGRIRVVSSAARGRAGATTPASWTFMSCSLLIRRRISMQGRGPDTELSQGYAGPPQGSLTPSGGRTPRSGGLGALYRNQAPHFVALHVAACTTCDHFAALHHQILVGELGGEVDVLLDEHDGHGLAVGQHADHAADVLDDRRLDAFGRLIEDQELRAGSKRACDGELL